MAESTLVREAMAKAARGAYPPHLFRAPSEDALKAAHSALQEHGSTLDGLSAHTIRECVGPWAMERVCRALVEAVGLSWVDVERLRYYSGDSNDHVLSERIAMILRAAGVDEP
jgi:hypothetical protein